MCRILTTCCVSRWGCFQGECNINCLLKLRCEGGRLSLTPTTAEKTALIGRYDGEWIKNTCWTSILSVESLVIIPCPPGGQHSYSMLFSDQSNFTTHQA